MKDIRLYLFIIISGLLFSCDSVHSISIVNSTQDTLNIYGIEDIKEDYKIQPNGYYKLPPNKTIQIGMAIAEIDNDIPTDTIIIKGNSTLIKAFNKKDIIDLFERNILNQIKTPYRINVK